MLFTDNLNLMELRVCHKMLCTTHKLLVTSTVLAYLEVWRKVLACSFQLGRTEVT